MGGVLVENESNLEGYKKRTISVPEDSERQGWFWGELKDIFV